MIRRVLVALDESARAPSVFRAAEAQALAFRAELLVLRVVFPPPEFPPAAASAPHDQLASQMADDARRELLGYIGRSAVAQSSVLVANQGTARDNILNTARQRQVDMIVMGSHGYRGLEHFFGTLTGSIADSARCNVLIVHDNEA